MIGQWLELFTPAQVVAVPDLAVAQAFRSLTSRESDLFDHWVEVLRRHPIDTELADGRSTTWAVVFFDAVAGSDGLDRMVADATLAYDLDHEGSPFRPLIRFLEGSARYLTGAHDVARESLDAALREAGDGLAPSRSLRWSGLALVELDARRWPEALSAISNAVSDRRRVPATGPAAAVDRLRPQRAHARSGRRPGTGSPRMERRA